MWSKPQGTLAVLELCALDILGEGAVSMFGQGETLDDEDRWRVETYVVGRGRAFVMSHFFVLIWRVSVCSSEHGLRHSSLSRENSAGYLCQTMRNKHHTA